MPHLLLPPLMGRFPKALKPLLELFLQAPCPLCDRFPAAPICQDCKRRLQRCKLSNITHLWQEQPSVFPWGRYGGVLKQAIATLKYDHHPELAQVFGHWLGQSWQSSPWVRSDLIVVPIPMHPDKQRKRGFNQAELLAEGFCAMTGLPLNRNGLTRVRATEAQFGLSRTQRQDNLSEAFELGHSWERQPPKHAVLLIDDIYTTGATARSAIKTLTQGRVKVYGIATLAIALHNNE